MVSLLLYLILFIYTLIMAYQMRIFDSKNKWTIGGKRIKGEIFWFFENILVWLPILLLYSLRNISVGTDTRTYNSYFNTIKSLGMEQLFGGFCEPGYYFLNAMVDKINGSVNILFLFCGFLMFAFLFIGLHEQGSDVKIEYGIFVYLMTLFSCSFNIVRQMVAMLIVFYGLRFIKERKLIKYAMTIILAMLFHLSAIFCICFYFFNCEWMIKNKRKWRGICVGLGVLSIFAIRFIKQIIVGIGFYSNYIDVILVPDFSELTCFIYVIPEMLLIGYLEKKAEDDNWITTLTNIFYFQIPFQFTQIYYHEILARIGLYCTLSRIVLIPYLLGRIRNSGQRKKCLFMCGIWYFIYFIVMSFVLNGADIFPYKFYWDN